MEAFGRCAVQGLDDEYWVPEHVREWLRSLGFTLPLEDMEPHIRAWDRWMRALGDFYDYRDTDGVGRVYEVHRRSIHPAMRVCREWGSLLLNDRTQVACAEQACTDWLAAWMARTGFLASAQEGVVRAVGLGTGAWALCGRGRGPRAPLRRADGRAAHVGRGGRDRVRVRDAGVLEGTCHRPGAAAPEGCCRRVLLAKRIIRRGFGGGSFSPN